ncbi:ATP-binding protein [Vulcanisaeta souniana]|uniref:ATPase domain-containing protein n=1 Tax=Vulcanisaeta souniana JCM 11219 TaxID=1293586 RepID=A0A830EBF8_9CREN|nr:ATP-binding protein [Vulcanisaeta souniana]BDR92094.1 hypothetical protein Vsou_11870 [Vulcanisaeta souniana JCM 11219]GGI67904.1 hypothetical protein GCM10007112_01210 [Vulcanisaeta souniana JCM 11219]
MEPLFVDRVSELGWLRGWVSRFRYVPLYVYGPEGCGKTRLLKEFVRRFREYFGGDAVAVYIDALEMGSIEKAVLTPPGLSLMIDAIRDVINGVLGVGPSLARAIADVLERAVGRQRLRGNYVLVVVDDVVRAVGMDRVEWYVKWLFELMNKLSSEYGPRAINFVVATSEGESLGSVTRHRHGHAALLWNLDREPFMELLNALNPPRGFDVEEAWRLLGGNPGKAMELANRYNWDLRAMLNDYVRRAVLLMDTIKARGLVNPLRMAINDVDTFYGDPGTTELRELLIRENYIIYKDWATLSGSPINPNQEIGVGRFYAWQTPIHREALATTLRLLGITA